jgi:hypothetical protein
MKIKVKELEIELDKSNLEELVLKYVKEKYGTDSSTLSIEEMESEEDYDYHFQGYKVIITNVIGDFKI